MAAAVSRLHCKYKNIVGTLAVVVGITIVIANLIQKTNQSMADESALNQESFIHQFTS